MLYMSPTGLQVMCVGGPNERSDFHVEAGEELFYMLEGDMVLRVEERGVLRDIRIREGEMFLLPGNIPHSPQRLAGTVGLVIERARVPGEVDGLRWYTAGGGGVLYEETFACTNLGTQLGPVIARFKASQEAATGVPRPGLPPSPLPQDTTTLLPPPTPLALWRGNGGSPQGLFSVEVHGSGSGGGSGEGGLGAVVDIPLRTSELFLLVVQGGGDVTTFFSSGGVGEMEASASTSTASTTTFSLATKDTLVVTNEGGGSSSKVARFQATQPGTLCLAVHY